MGGKAFNETRNSDGIHIQDFPKTLMFLESLVGKPLDGSLLGSSGKKELSGDIDLIAPLPREQLIQKLLSYETQENPNKNILKLKCPINGDSSNGFVQVDFLFGDAIWLKWALCGSEPSGAHRGNLIQAIVQNTGNLILDKDLKISGRCGYSYDRAYGFRKQYQQRKRGKKKPFIGLLRRVDKDDFYFPAIDEDFPTITDPKKAVEIMFGAPLEPTQFMDYQTIRKQVEQMDRRFFILKDFEDIMNRNGVTI